MADANVPAEGQFFTKEQNPETPVNEADNLLNYWYPICFAESLEANFPYPFELFGEPLVMFRGSRGQPVCVHDKCPHRSAPLSIGKVQDGKLQCRYHGWRFNDQGKCDFVPSLEKDKEIPKSLCVYSYPCTEREGMVFVWPGEPSLANDGRFPTPQPELGPDGNPEKGWVKYDQIIDQDYSTQALIENLLDPGHLQFTHEGAQGKYIGPTDQAFPDTTRYTIEETGVKHGFKGYIKTDTTAKPQELTISFDAPFTVRIEIVFANGWRFHQVHYCIPISKYKTRLIFRSMRDWMKWMPDSIMWKANPAVLRQDASVLMGQRQRLEQGGSRWNFPVRSDAMGIRFRNYWDKAEANCPPWFGGYTGSSFKKNGGVSRVPYGDMKDVPREYDNPQDVLVGTDSPSLKTVKQVVKEAKEGLWPAQFQAKTGIPFL